MDWVYELVCTGAADSADDVRPWSDAAARAWSAVPGLSEAIRSPAFALSLGGRPLGLSLTGSGFERRFYPVADEMAAGPLTAPFSYVVRYYKPAEDEAAFIRNYVNTHPATLAKLP